VLDIHSTETSSPTRGSRLRPVTAAFKTVRDCLRPSSYVIVGYLPCQAQMLARIYRDKNFLRNVQFETTSPLQDAERFGLSPSRPLPASYNLSHDPPALLRHWSIFPEKLKRASPRTRLVILRFFIQVARRASQIAREISVAIELHVSFQSTSF
jgi:hypothetical protein